MIGRYLTQSTIWRARTGHDAYGKPQYAADTLILARWEPKRRLVRNLAGEQVVSEARCFVTAAVKVGDSLTDPQGRSWTVITVSVHHGLGGNEAFREVMV